MDSTDWTLRWWTASHRCSLTPSTCQCCSSDRPSGRSIAIDRGNRPATVLNLPTAPIFPRIITAGHARVHRRPEGPAIDRHRPPPAWNTDGTGGPLTDVSASQRATRSDVVVLLPQPVDLRPSPGRVGALRKCCPPITALDHGGPSPDGPPTDQMARARTRGTPAIGVDPVQPAVRTTRGDQRALDSCQPSRSVKRRKLKVVSRGPRKTSATQRRLLTRLREAFDRTADSGATAAGGDCRRGMEPARDRRGGGLRARGRSDRPAGRGRRTGQEAAR